MVETGDESGAGPLLKNRYQLGRVLGRGGMCIVYQAWDTRLQRFVAIKRLEPPLNEDPRTRARFDREGRALALLSHPNLVALIDRGSSETDDYLVFEYVEGRSLKELIRDGHLGIETFGLIVGQVAEGLAAAHLTGIIHRDVKPQNILVDRQGHAKVSDFGIATGPDWTRVTRAGAVIGSARYMSPEQIRSKPVDPRSDVYSLGVVMYEMLTGHPPFDGTNMPEIARLHLQAPPPPMTDARTRLPEGLEKVVMRCLEKDPDDRFGSMDVILGALVGLGLYAPRESVETTSSRRRILRRGAPEEESPRRSSAAPRASGARESGEEGDRRWAREQARALARKRRSAKRKRIAAVAAGAIVLIILISVLATRSGAGVPDVKYLTLDQATQQAASKGLEIEVAEKIPTFDRQPDIVLSQVPEVGVTSTDGKIQVTLSMEPTQVQINYLQDYDPGGDNGRENPEQVANLIDNKESTTWSTESYKQANFSGLKSGVGLRFTLAEPATLIKIVSTTSNWQGELQLTTEGAVVVVAQLGGQSVTSLDQPVTEGLIWFTTLGLLPNSDRYGVQVAEIAFYK
jgi:hypothetical protein